MVQSVTGPVSAAELGRVLPHEHIFLDGFTVALTPELILDDPKIARSELELFVRAGGRTIVELTIHGLNPEPVGLRRIAEETGITVIAGCGFYWERYYPDWVSSMSIDQLTEFILRELNQGIAGSDVRAGVIGEIGSGNRVVSPAEERVFRAAAAAQREASVALFTHAPFGRVGLKQIDILKDAGADLSRVVISHVDTVHDTGYHVELAERGVWLSYDTIGRRDSGRDEDRADSVIEMVRKGYARQMLLSSDICRRGHLHYYGGHGYDHVFAVFLPMLRERGLTQEEIDLLTIENPRRLLTFPAA